VNVDTGEIYTDGTTPVQILNMHMIFTSYYHYSEEKVNRWYPVRDPDTKTNFKLSENYRGGWFYRIYEPGGYVGVLKSQYKSFVNIGNNSIIIPNRIVTMGERVFYQGSGEALDITPLSVEPSTRFGRLSIPVGYEGGIVNSVYDSAYSRENYTFEWTSSNESVLKVDENGNVRAVGVGFADIELTVSRKPVDGLEGGTLGGEHIQIYVYDTHEAINTSDAFEVEHTHEYVEIQRDADCELGGASIFVCSHPDCADYYEVSATPALGHSFGEYVSNKDATSTLDGTKTAVCTKCSKKDTVCDENSRGTNLEENVEDKGILKTDKTQMEQYVGGLVNGDIAQIQAPSHSGVEIPTSALEGMLDKSCTVTIEIGDIEAFIYPETLGGILESVNGETVTFHIKNTGTSSLNEKQLSAIEGAETAGIISAEIYSNGEYIHSFGVNNKIDLRIPFFNTSAQNSSEYKVYYLDEEGKISPVWCMWEDIEGGVMTFSTDHFSTYIIAKGVKEESPANDSIIPVICGVCGGVVVVAGVILIVSVKKRRKAQR